LSPPLLCPHSPSSFGVVTRRRNYSCENLVSDSIVSNRSRRRTDHIPPIHISGDRHPSSMDVIASYSDRWADVRLDVRSMCCTAWIPLVVRCSSTSLVLRGREVVLSSFIGHLRHCPTPPSLTLAKHCCAASTRALDTDDRM